jgi:defect in organelle trafficking protein DotA
MNQLVVTLFLFLFPGLVLADGSLSFAPPASDYSVVFLSNLFGVVDGVLSGTGSQIMGSMFAVFNSAVLTLGGIVIMYTIIVSTMNTAHEGQMLGQKWSSIWIPIRATVGLALLIPKASGYCLMQIFVMWVVVQGVGAADKVWDAALSYLNRGGVIIQAQQINPANELINSSSSIGSIATGAINILSGQVCMLGLQNQLQKQRQTLIDAGSSGSSGCSSASKQTLCDYVVPDFISSVNAVYAQTTTSSDADNLYKVTMPNFPPGSQYAFLNGICGTIKWYNINNIITIPKPQPPSEDNTTNNITVGNTTLTPAEAAATQMSRAIAVQQMYMDLSSVARIMVGNDPQLATSGAPSSTPYPNPNAIEQFGVPYTQAGDVCDSYSNATPESLYCVIWGTVPGTVGGTLMNGTEVFNAINDYNAVMMPTLNLVEQINNSTTGENAKSFINEASTRGWMMAGSYFFDLVEIQGVDAAGSSSTQTDSLSGLSNSQFSASTITSPFKTSGGQSQCNGDYKQLCDWFDGNVNSVQQVQNLITNDETANPKPSPPDPVTGMKVIKNPVNTVSTVYAFLNNAMMMQTPGQPGTKPLTFASKPNFSVNADLYKLKTQDFDCGKVKILFFSFCLGRMMGNLFWNVLLVPVYNAFLAVFGEILQTVLMAFLQIPLQGMADIFSQSINIIAAPGVNPVVALANMGIHYINFAGNLWIYLLGLSISSSILIPFGIFIFAMLALSMPLIFAWLGIMVSIGFTTAYYIPILPYMIFTFGSIGWLIAVIEAMVAGPIVALGVTHPEGHDAFGKGEAAIMILINVFLRPAMMIIGYIAAIALSYVGVWVLNAGYDHAIAFMQKVDATAFKEPYIWLDGQNDLPTSSGSGQGGTSYSDWAGIFAFFFSILTYVSMYLVIVQKSFTLISYLPDKVLRWIGGSPESLGQESAQWGEEVKGQHKEAGKASQDVQQQVGKMAGAKATQKFEGAMGKLVGKAGGGGDMSSQGVSSSKSKSDGNKDQPGGKGKDSGSGDGLGGAEGGAEAGSKGASKAPISK